MTTIVTCGTNPYLIGVFKIAVAACGTAEVDMDVPFGSFPGTWTQLGPIDDVTTMVSNVVANEFSDNDHLGTTLVVTESDGVTLTGTTLGWSPEQVALLTGRPKSDAIIGASGALTVQSIAFARGAIQEFAIIMRGAVMSTISASPATLPAQFYSSRTVAMSDVELAVQKGQQGTGSFEFKTLENDNVPDAERLGVWRMAIS